MARYFFHLSDGLGLDDEGVELADIESAKGVAMKLVGQCLIDRAEDFWNAPDWTLRVSDENGLTLFTLMVLGTAAPAVNISLTAIPMAEA